MKKIIMVTLGMLSAGLLCAQTGKLYIGPENPTDTRWATKADFDGSIIFCRGFYTSDRQEANGGGWWTDYPGGDNNFLVRLSELTETRVRFSKDRIPFFVVVHLDDPLLFKCPILFMEDVGTVRFTDRQVEMLTRYFAQGGFLWVDDFWGSQAWEQWEYEIRRVLPSGTHPMFDIPTDHPIMHMLYEVPKIHQQPTIGLWNTSCSGDEFDSDATVIPCLDQRWPTSERGADSAEVHFRGIQDENGHLQVVMTHNTDIADGWEEEKPNNMAYIHEFSAKCYAIGVNIFLYALTH